MQEQNTNDNSVGDRLNNSNIRGFDSSIPQYSNPQGITVEKLKSFLPKGTSFEVTQAIVDKINNTGNETGLMQEVFEEKVLSYLHLLNGKGRSLEKLVNALKYCSLKLIAGMTNEKAWAIVFPDKYDKLVAERRFVGSHVSSYNGSDMVVEIDKLLMIPVAVEYAPMFHFGVKKLYDLANGIGARATDKVSATVQMMAATELVKITKMPEVAKVEVDVKVNQGSIIDEYEKAISMMAQAKLDNISGLTNHKEVFNIINSSVRAKHKEPEIIDVETE